MDKSTLDQPVLLITIRQEYDRYIFKNVLIDSIAVHYELDLNETLKL